VAQNSCPNSSLPVEQTPETPRQNAIGCQGRARAQPVGWQVAQDNAVDQVRELHGTYDLAVGGQSLKVLKVD
jgi:hypothetical protein